MVWQKIVWALHRACFVGFLASAVIAGVVWETTGTLEGTVVATTITAFFATTSAFVERLFPLSER